MLQEKISHIQALLKKQKIDTLVVGNFGHQIADDLLFYLTLTKLEYAMLVIPSSGVPTLYGISFEVGQLKIAFPEINVTAFDKPATTLLLPHLEQIKIIGIREDALPTSLYKKIQTSYPNKTITHIQDEEKIIAIKLEKEQEYMQKAAQITDMIFDELKQAWSGFRTEMDAANFIKKEIVERGLDPSFSPIVASGLHAANPHHHPIFKEIQPGFCVIDFGVRFKGYCSDMTRTLFVGEPTKQEEALYKTVQQVQEETISQIKPGITTKKLDDFCRLSLGETLNKEFIHSLGHGVGSQVHEWPRVSAKDDVTLEEGMIITIEPGVYQQGNYGIRIEDGILVTKNGHEVLTKSDKNFTIST